MPDKTRQKQTHQARPAGPDGPSRHQSWKIFDRIAGRYDLLNHLLSANIDKRWRRILVGKLPPRQNMRVLDLATGTGDQLIALLEHPQVASGIGIDMAEQMLAIGRQKLDRLNLTKRTKPAELISGDAQQIPFETSSFDATSISFGIRNMTDPSGSLAEMYRVLKPGGRSLILEFSLPSKGWIKSIYLFYLRRILPRLGRLISGDDAAYRYLNQTIETFPYGQDFCNLMTGCGFANVEATELQLGIATIYQGDKV